MSQLIDRIFIQPHSPIWRWVEIFVVLVGVANFIFSAIAIIDTKNTQEKYISVFLKNSDFISFVIIEYWGMYFLLAIFGVVIAGYLYKDKKLPFGFSISITVVYIVCAEWMVFSAMSVMSHLQKMVNA